MSFDVNTFILDTFLEDLNINLKLERAFAAFLLLDTVIRLFTGYYSKGLLIIKPKLIFFNYMKNDFIYDLIAYFPVIVNGFFSISDDSALKPLFMYSKSLIFIKILKVVNVIRSLEEIIHFNDNGIALFQLIKLIFAIFLFCNIMACLWHIAAITSDDSLLNMIKIYKLEDKDWQTKYAKFLFVTVNAGKADPQNNSEMIFGFFALISTSGSMGFLISGIHNIMRVLGKSSQQHRFFFLY